MTRNRVRRRLMARRLRLCRSLCRGATLPGRYDRMLLFGGGVVMTILALAVASIGIAHRFERCIDDWRAEFLAQRDFVNASVERNQARLRHMVETYEALAHVHERDAVPTERYRRLLERTNGVVVTEEDVGAAPFTLFSTLTGDGDSDRLAMLLRLVREISPGSLLRQRRATEDIGGFLYTEDKRFLAAWPPLGAARTADACAGGIEPTIAHYVASVDAELRKHSEADLRRDRVFWVALYDSPMYGTLVKHYAAPIYRDNARIAVLVVTVPATQIPRLFQPAVHDPDFFMVSRDRRHLLGLDESNPRKRRWVSALFETPSVFDMADERVRFVRRRGDFFLVQRIAGPQWIAVSAFDWRTILANLSGPVCWTVALTSLVLAVQWAFIVLIDRLVLAPLRVRARRVFESEAFSRTVLATAPVGLTVFDPSTQRIVMQNGIARALLAGSGDEAGFYRRLVEGPPRRRRAARRQMRRHAWPAPGDAVRTVEVTVAAADGRRRELSVALARARYREQEVVLCSLTDISRQKETVRLLRRARHASDEASRAKSMLVATISHEIRTPLYGALGNLELLSLERLAPSQAARVGSVRRAFDALLALVDDVLDVSKAEARQLHLHVEPFRVDELIERCAQTFAPAIAAKGLRFSCLVEPAVAGTWHGDGRRVTQVVTNLLGNACKFTQHGAITLRASVAAGADGRESIVVSVADSGIGIASSQQARIFEPFTQADGSIGQRFGGTGLGLSLCRRLVELMGGRIEVNSAEGRGAIFTVRLELPREPAPESAMPLPPVEPPAFDALVVACESAAWQANLVAQLRQRFEPAVRVVEAGFAEAVAPGCARSVLILGVHADVLPAAWRNLRAAYLDIVVVSERGPLHPQRRFEALHVTALSAAKLRLALAACGRQAGQGQVPAPPDYAHPAPARTVHCAARILVVEDDPVSRTLLAHQLEVLGYRYIDLAGDGEEALARCLRQAYDLVLADLCMPTMGGRELLAALRGKGMTMPVIAHTAAPYDPALAEHEGFARLVHKPLTLECLRAALEGVLGDAFAGSGATTGAIGSAVAFSAALRNVFAATWKDDDARLAAAIQASDREALLQTLHRVKGALLALGEHDVAMRCDGLRDELATRGVAAIAGRLAALRRRIGAVAGPAVSDGASS
ncbi:ATP-binding protein [Trinickia caryophylli]|uniref:Virulence sensor protein BvgS n=1 Tax=Trinickia caryophylli TaxID=28094 RepID=A0A1X7FK66_TRICW|nr:hybrid sensor histidine kinase/response regulator [Trinickia caryophylli]PMS13156.1 sensor histidine kinase [Trinickia caryophylli]TRX19318.1 response regulator [Trinickia caryophylli]WQE13380.1 ATP-binding protein [Trinickia caryophylli]SMF53682.1 two-component system, NarL family, capsular synthesis sensor histidine kinase RcsC [Trinickia caryophylli]GLU34102.1 hypothetical protein Busp01_39440 [Trinickia caryophylli]